MTSRFRWFILALMGVLAVLLLAPAPSQAKEETYFVIPAVAGPARLVPLEALVTSALSLVAMRAAWLSWNFLCGPGCGFQFIFPIRQ